MRDILRVAQWEFTKGIKNKTFLFLTFVFPIIIVLITGVVSYFTMRDVDGSNLNLAIVDETDFMTTMLEENFTHHEYQAEFISPDSLAEIEETFQEGDYDAILHIPENVVETNEVYYFFKEISGLETDFIKNILTDILVNKRLVDKGYSPLEIKELTANVRIINRLIKGEEEEEFSFGIILPFFMAMFMFFAVFLSGSILLQSIITEKTNRIVEIILSSISARALMFGKIIAYALISMVQILIWLLVAVLLILLIDPKLLASMFTFKIILILLYVFFCFAIIAGLNAIIGASTKDAQSGNQSAGYIMLIPLIPIYFTTSIMQNPGGVLSKVLSYIPFFTPTTMMIRLGFSTPPAKEIIATFALLLVFTYILMILAAKLFRIGMLMYGKNVNLKELIKWARSKDY